MKKQLETAGVLLFLAAGVILSARPGKPVGGETGQAEGPAPPAAEARPVSMRPAEVLGAADRWNDSGDALRLFVRQSGDPEKQALGVLVSEGGGSGWKSAAAQVVVHRDPSGKSTGSLLPETAGEIKDQLTHTLTAQIPPDKRGVSMRLRAVTRNIASNGLMNIAALALTPDGRVAVGIELSRDGKAGLIPDAFRLDASTADGPTPLPIAAHLVFQDKDKAVKALEEEKISGLAGDVVLVSLQAVPGGDKPFMLRAGFLAASAQARDEIAVSGPSLPVAAEAAWFNGLRLNVALLLAAVAGLIFWFMWQAKRSANLYVRRIPGIDAIEEAIGRATEMGRPVLYVPGILDMTNIQTISSMLILGKVAEMVAEYDSDIVAPNMIPFVREVAADVVKQAYYNAGRPDAFKPESVPYLSQEQFAFTAGVNGIMLRDKPAANIYLGGFYAESLILSETGFQAKAIQVAGTAEVTQLPFFIAACDYTLIGEELFAASAYMSKDPRMLSTLKAADWAKMLFIGLIVIGSVSLSLGMPQFSQFFEIAAMK